MPTSTGSTRSSPIAATSADHEKNGTRLIRIPGARVVSTVAATGRAAAASPMTARANPARNRSTISASPPPGPPLLASATITIVIPPTQAQKPAIARRGKASERAPSCSGTTATATPRRSGTTTP